MYSQCIHDVLWLVVRSIIDVLYDDMYRIVNVYMNVVGSEVYSGW